MTSLAARGSLDMYTWAIALLVGFAIAGAVLAVVGLVQAPPEPVEDPEVPGATRHDESPR
jgi:hypothetical protein